MRIERFSTSTVNSMREETGHQQRQQHVDIVRQFQSEDDARERRPHRAAQNRAHANQRPEPRAFVRKKHRL